MRVRYVCPCCGADIGEAASLDEVSKVLTQSQRIVFSALARHPGSPVANDALVSALYDHRADGGPDWARNNVTIFISQTRTRIEKYGWTIVSRGRGGGRGNTASYRLIPTTKSA